MELEPEYAPQYTMRERWRCVAIVAVCFAVMWAMREWWPFPQLQVFAQTAHCRTVLGMPGRSVVLYGVFLGMPLAAAMSMGAIIVPPALRSIRTRRYPPLGKKVLGRVKVQTGRTAVLSAATDLVLAAALFAIAIWGGLKAAELTKDFKSVDGGSCETSMERRDG